MSKNNNLFLGKDAEELQILYEQYLFWCQKGYIDFESKELLNISDKYSKIYPNGAHIIILEKDLLAAIANSWHTHELERKFIKENAVSEGFLQDWYQSSVTDDPPVWTDEHIAEVYGDFYLIPKEVIDKNHKN